MTTLGSADYHFAALETSQSDTPFGPHLVVAARYELLRLIGQGGMGEVWEARHLELDAPVAIKFAIERRIHDRSFLARFHREARALARLRFPNIVQVFDIGVHEGFPFIVMELLVGESLKSRLEREQHLSLSDASQIVTQIGRALTVIHSAGMVHRDVTPGNIFLTEIVPQLPEVNVKLLDFGIIKEVATDARVTVSGVVVGSPSYMSPEQARAESVDKRSDLWSLGALTFRAITGEDPFVGRSVTEVLFAICTGEIPSLASSFPLLGSRLDEFFARALARNPSQRFSDAIELTATFSAIAAADDAPARSPSKFSSGHVPLRTGIARTQTTANALMSSAPSSIARKRPRVTVRVYFIASVVLLGITLVFISLTRRFRNSQNGSTSVELPRVSGVPQVQAMAPPPLRSEASKLQESPPPSDVGNIQPPANGGASTLTASKRRTSKIPNGTRPAKDAVDPIFGLPTQK